MRFCAAFALWLASASCDADRSHESTPEEVAAEQQMTPAQEDSLRRAEERRADSLTSAMIQVSEAADKVQLTVPVDSPRRINILIYGVDSRVGESSRRTDANHVVSIVPDSGIVNIFSIPRDTEADCGMVDSMARFNILANVFSHRGRSAYLQEVARISGVIKIHYWVEVGFSQAMGILRLLGSENASSTLRVLRSRKGSMADDFQRSYNQGQFIRQTLLTKFDKLTGLLGAAVIRGGLAIAESNMPYDTVGALIERLETAGFPSGPDAVTVQLRPSMRRALKVFNLTSSNTIDSINATVDKEARRRGDTVAATPGTTPQSVIRKLIADCRADSAKPRNVLRKLKRPFEQRVWLQIDSDEESAKARDQIGALLKSAYLAVRDTAAARSVEESLALERRAFEISHPQP